MEFDPDDYSKTICEIKKEYPKIFWQVWNEIKARKLEYKKPDQLYVGIIGTRRRDSSDDWIITYETFVRATALEVEDGKTDIVIVSGLCTKGGDKFAVTLYKKFKTKKLWFPAQWNALGFDAGFIRNTDIALVSDILIAVRNYNCTGGTEDTIRKFIQFGKENHLIIV
jgi:hypothetical protein